MTTCLLSGAVSIRQPLAVGIRAVPKSLAYCDISKGAIRIRRRERKREGLKRQKVSSSRTSRKVEIRDVQSASSRKSSYSQPFLLTSSNGIRFQNSSSQIMNESQRSQDQIGSSHQLIPSTRSRIIFQNEERVQIQNHGI